MDKSKLASFGTEQYPLRPSRLGDWMRCPLKAAMEFLADQDRGSGKAADTGSAVHAAIAAWHNDPERRETVALGVMWTKVEKEYPLADLTAAERFFQFYIKDPRNTEAEIVAVEKPITLTLQAAETDPTQEKIVIKGTLDQLRRDPSGALRVVDVKTGGLLTGFQMVTEHALQMACYQVGASEEFGPVSYATILRVQDYIATPRKKPGPVFWSIPYGLREARSLLDGLRSYVAMIRSGRVYALPSAQCQWCSLDGPGNCLPLLGGFNHG